MQAHVQLDLVLAKYLWQGANNLRFPPGYRAPILLAEHDFMQTHFGPDHFNFSTFADPSDDLEPEMLAFYKDLCSVLDSFAKGKQHQQQNETTSKAAHRVHEQMVAQGKATQAPADYVPEPRRRQQTPTPQTTRS